MQNLTIYKCYQIWADKFAVGLQLNYILRAPCVEAELRSIVGQRLAFCSNQMIVRNMLDALNSECLDQFSFCELVVNCLKDDLLNKVLIC